MKVLLLGDPRGNYKPLEEYMKSCGDDVVIVVDKITREQLEKIGPDILVSYGYRFILKPEIFQYPRLGSVNLHISYLPWNRGVDPNFWSHAESTAKGVTIHHIDTGIDTGDIIVQYEVSFSQDDTLASSYAKLHSAIRELFSQIWAQIKEGKAPRTKQATGGTVHHRHQIDVYQDVLQEKGWDTPIRDVAVLKKR